MFNTSELSIMVPGLAAILSQQINKAVLGKNLTKIIKHGQFTADDSGLDRLLFNSFSQHNSADNDLALASLAAGNNNSLFASPCYLHPDRDRLLLFADDLDISTVEMQALIAEIQPLVDDFSGVLSIYNNKHLLLQLPHLPQLQFSALADVNGGSVDPFLPSGSDSQTWLTLWNEIQMQLFNAEINQQRQQQGKVPINSVWFWGAGQFIAKQNPWQTVQGHSDVLALLCQQIKLKLAPLDALSLNHLSTGRHLVVLDVIDVEANWIEQLADLEQLYFAKVWQYCRRGQITKLTVIIPNHGRYSLKPLDCWKFWK